MNGKSKTGEPCIICLNEKDTHQMRGIDCECKYYIHQSCHIEYVNHNQKMECPICHVVSTMNPMMTVYVRRNELIGDTSGRKDDKCVKGCMLGCCCYCIFMGILGAIFG